MSDVILCQRYEKNPDIVVITFNKPKKLNALSLEDLQELEKMVDELQADRSCRVIIITGNGRGFVSGADISGLKTASKEHSMAYSRLAKRVYEKLERGRPTVIAAVNGYALEKAKSYQETMSMSKSAIYDQLVSEYGEQFTADEAQYAVDHLE